MNAPQLSTNFLLLAQYGGKAVIPVEDICRHYFSHLDPVKFLRKVGNGEIPLPFVRRAGGSRPKGSISKTLPIISTPAGRRQLRS